MNNGTATAWYDKRQSRFTLISSILLIGIFILMLLNIALGTVHIPLSEIVGILLGRSGTDVNYNIVMLYRLPQTLTACIAGAGLAVSGLQMQTLFRNPLADPSVLGVSSGASLGVALLVLVSGHWIGEALSSFGLWGNLSIFGAALLGALSVLALVLALSRRLKDNSSLLVVGIMVGYVVYSVVSILKYYSNSDDLHQFVVWGLGSFSDLGWSQLAFFSCVVAIALVLSFLLSKSLNLMLLGDQYAQSLGLNIKRTRLSIVLLTGILASVITAFCGPIAFIGFAVPHLTKTLLRTSNHLLLVPAVALSGSLLALICNLLARLPYGFDGALPINAVTSLFGAPIVLWMVLSKRKG